MDKLEEVFLKRWSIKEDPNMLLTRLNNLVKQENETIREFHNKFETLLQKIPLSHHPSPSFLLFIYTKAFTG
jgi:Tfp pilus assembly protein PilN